MHKISHEQIRHEEIKIPDNQMLSNDGENFNSQIGEMAIL